LIEFVEYIPNFLFVCCCRFLIRSVIYSSFKSLSQQMSLTLLR